MLELAAGTGRLAIPLAARGIEVDGISRGERAADHQECPPAQDPSGAG